MNWFPAEFKSLSAVIADQEEGSVPEAKCEGERSGDSMKGTHGISGADKAKLFQISPDSEFKESPRLFRWVKVLQEAGRVPDMPKF